LRRGLTNREIGGELHLAEKTVKNSVSNVLAKLDMQRRTEAAVLHAGGAGHAEAQGLTSDTLATSYPHPGSSGQPG
jgi:hypothetical protein